MRPTPTAQGSFEKTPFAHLLIYLRDRRMTGTLAIQYEGAIEEMRGETLIAFDAGRLALVRLPSVQEPLGVLLWHMGLITEAAFQESLARLARNEGLQGQILIGMGACDEATIERGLRAQVRRKTLHVFQMDRAAYQYYGDVDLLEGYGRERFSEDVFAVLWQGIRTRTDSAAVEKVIENVGAKWLRLKSPSDVAAFEFDRAERGLLDVLRADPAPVSQLLRAGLDPPLARAMIYLLVATKQVDMVSPTSTAAPAVDPVIPPSLQSAAAQSAAAVSAQATAPARSSFAPSAAARAPGASAIPVSNDPKVLVVRKRLAAMETQTYFEMLELESTASSDDISERFLELAAIWHPDRVPHDQLELKSVHQQVFAYLNEAQQTLTDDISRGKYLRTVQDGGGTPAAHKKMAETIEAATDIQKAEVCLRMRDFAEAERLCRKALAVTPDDVSGSVVLAQILVDRQGDDPTGEAMKLLTRAVEIAPKSDRAHVLLGGIYKRRGNLVQSLSHFRTASRANPKNIDAQREMRLAEMRGLDRSTPESGKTSSSDSSKAGGFLSKFLKK